MEAVLEVMFCLFACGHLEKQRLSRMALVGWLYCYLLIVSIIFLLNLQVI